MTDDRKGNHLQASEGAAKEGLRRVLGHIEDFEDDIDEEGAELLAQIYAQSTTGPYPPPIMLKQYNDIDPKITKEILDAARSQRAHRQRLETQTTEQTNARLMHAQRAQSFIAYASLILGALLAAVPPFFGFSVNWIIIVALWAIGVGGRPAATIITTWITKQTPSS